MLADVRFEQLDGGMIARVAGEVDMSNADEIGNAIRQVVSNELAVLILDLSEVGYLDSAGIRLIFELRAGLDVRGQRLRLVVPGRSPVRDALGLAGILEALDVEMTIEAATEALRDGDDADRG
jgi:anti-anti-sigma factor